MGQGEATVSLPRARIKVIPEDFVVDEIPAYSPSGQGNHLLLRFEKRDLTTPDAVRAIGRALSVPGRDIGIAGLKDKVAVTTQWISLPYPGEPRKISLEEELEALELPGIRILSFARHDNKLRTGHLTWNRFKIRLRGVPASRVSAVIAGLERVAACGLPNAFGAQRFGRDRDNADRALSFLRGESRPPRDARQRRFLFSALQSQVYNRVLEARVADGTWNVPLEGDLLKLESGGLFLCTDPGEDRARAARGELGPTGPIFGVKMREPGGAVLALELRILRETVGEGFDLARTKPLGEGTRRALVLRVSELEARVVPGGRGPEDGGSGKEGEGDGGATGGAAGGAAEGSAQEQPTDLWVEFMLPKGAYATTVLARVVDVEEGTPDENRTPTEAAEDN